MPNALQMLIVATLGNGKELLLAKSGENTEIIFIHLSHSLKMYCYIFLAIHFIGKENRLIFREK